MRNKKLRWSIYIMVSLLTLNMTALSFAGEKLNLKATASSVHYYFAASNAVDGDKKTYWIGAPNNDSWWIMVDAGKITYFEEIRFGWHNSYYMATDFDIQISQDGQTWEDVYTGLSGEYNGPGILKSYGLSKEARYARIYINSVRYLYPMIPEIEIYASMHKSFPRKMRFQGRLKDKDGLDIDGTLKLTFRIYDTETGGVPLWSETQQGIVIEEGMLDIVLGSVNEIDLPFDKQCYLGVEIEEDGEMTPRFLMTSVPYAFSSER